MFHQSKSKKRTKLGKNCFIYVSVVKIFKRKFDYILELYFEGQLRIFEVPRLICISVENIFSLKNWFPHNVRLNHWILRAFAKYIFVKLAICMIYALKYETNSR